MQIGDKVKIKTTSDEDIDKYEGQDGVIEHIAIPRAIDDVSSYYVLMQDGIILTLNEDEFDAV